MGVPPTDDRHPLVLFGERRGWAYERTARHFRISYGEFRQLVTGWSGVSYRRAKRWAKRGEHEFSPLEVLEWHEQRKRSAA